MVRVEVNHSLGGAITKILYVDKLLILPVKSRLYIADVMDSPGNVILFKRTRFHCLFIPRLFLISLETLLFQTVTAACSLVHVATSPFIKGF